MRQRAVKHDSGDMGRRPRRPVLAAGEAAGEDEHVVGEARHGKGVATEIVERGRGAEWGDDPALRLIFERYGNKPERGDMYPPLVAESGDDAFADHRHSASNALISFRASSWRPRYGRLPSAASCRRPARRRQPPNRAA